jgi:hypothetical protein
MVLSSSFAGVISTATISVLLDVCHGDVEAVSVARALALNVLALQSRVDHAARLETQCDSAWRIKTDITDKEDLEEIKEISKYVKFVYIIFAIRSHSEQL